MSTGYSRTNTKSTCTTFLFLMLLAGTGFTPCVQAAYDAVFYSAVSAYDQGQYKRAYKLFNQSARRENPEAQYNLGILHLN